MGFSKMRIALLGFIQSYFVDYLAKRLIPWQGK